MGGPHLGVAVDSCPLQALASIVVARIGVAGLHALQSAELLGVHPRGEKQAANNQSPAHKGGHRCGLVVLSKHKYTI